MSEFERVFRENRDYVFKYLMKLSRNAAVPLEMTATRLPFAVYLYASCGFFSISRHGSATPGE